jgi:hypothetical protein
MFFLKIQIIFGDLILQNARHFVCFKKNSMLFNFHLHTIFVLWFFIFYYGLRFLCNCE